MFSINCKGKLLSWSDPLVMGIINATPDSFVEGHLSKGTDGILQLAATMIAEGADILDIGGQSTRPGSARVTAAEEKERVLPIIKAIHQQWPDMILSIDTYHSEVAGAAVEAGASIVNDISSGDMDPGMLALVAELKTPYICMHIKGTPDTMQVEPHYDNVVTEVLDYLVRKIRLCHDAGIHDLIIDPGFGFGKTIQHNFRLLHALADFGITGKPVLAGLSRKRTIYKTLGTTAAEALNGTTVLNTIALQNGAAILRVHDVKAAKEAVTLYTAYKKATL